ncbi:MAG: PQQ-dependent sugar dehydrogenase, partial [Bacteroidota bacterium]
YLYIGFGDGGNAFDPLENGQNPANFFGTILRIDVNVANGYRVPDDNPFVDDELFAEEVWAYGLRHPWRFSFDRLTGDLFTADVGQEGWEEINFHAAGEAGGMNYGWRVFEGKDLLFDSPPISDVTFPIYEYGHDVGCSITGGYVYRGTLLPELQGTYVYGDYCTGNIWGLRQEVTGIWASTLLWATDFQIVSFAESALGELYVVDYSGQVYALHPKDE